jgi:chaperone modulatory protein CbpM
MANDKTEFQSGPVQDSSPSGVAAETRMLPQLSGIILEELTELTLAELCRACAVHSESIVELVEEGVLAPLGREPHRWRFSGVHMRRATVALRLQRDLAARESGVPPSEAMQSSIPRKKLAAGSRPRPLS